MSKIKILETTNGLHQTAKSILDTITGMQSDAARQFSAMRDVEAKIIAIEKTRQAREEQRKKQELQQKQMEQRSLAAAAASVQEEKIQAQTEKAEKSAPKTQPAEQSMTQGAPVSTASQDTPGDKETPVPPAQSVTASAPDQETKPAAKAGSDAATAQTQEERSKERNNVPEAQTTQSAPAAKRDKGGQKREQPARQKNSSAQQQDQRSRNRQQPRSGGDGSQQVAAQAGGGRQQAAHNTPAAQGGQRSDHGRKRRDDNQGQDRKKKKSGIKERVFTQDYDDMPKGSRKRSGQRKQQKRTHVEPVRIDHAVITEDTVSVRLLSEKIGKPVTEILKQLLLLGMTSAINSQIDFDTAQLVASEFGVELEQKLEKTAEEILVEEAADEADKLVKRPPVVTIMGHVDHGKTSLLDRIRLSRVTETEAGGITQHIGAYQVELNGEKITFIDTPGHEAFTAMRARGAQVTDIAVIVVAADDGIMPQTIEAINHAKSADVPIIVAVNKIDRENANVSKIMQELTEYELLPEEWGGDTVVVPVSAKTGEGIDKLLEMILLVADIQELKANPDRLARGTIVEAQLDKGRGPVATVLVQTGTLKTGDTIIAGIAFGRVRAMLDDRGNSVKQAFPSQPVEVIGFSEVPVAGDVMHAAEGALSKKVAEERKAQQKADKLRKSPQVSLDDLFNQISEGQIKDLNIVIKADVQGSVEAVRQSLEKLSNDEVRVRAIHTGVGAITETDVLLASAANAIIVGFNVRPDNMAVTAAEREQVDIRLYRVIYKAIEDIESAMAGLLDPEFEEVVTGHAEVRQTFKVSSVGTIAGCYVQDGVIRRNSQVRLVRDGVVIYEGYLSSLRRFKDDVREVTAGYECGMSLENFNDIKDGDVVEGFEMQQIER